MPQETISQQPTKKTNSIENILGFEPASF